MVQPVSSGPSSPFLSLRLNRKSEQSYLCILWPRMVLSAGEKLLLKFFSLLGVRIAEPPGGCTRSIVPGVLSQDSPADMPPLASQEVCLEEGHHPETSTTASPPVSHSHCCGHLLHTGNFSPDLSNAFPLKERTLGGAGPTVQVPCPSAHPVSLCQIHPWGCLSTSWASCERIIPMGL